MHLGEKMTELGVAKGVIEKPEPPPPSSPTAEEGDARALGDAPRASSFDEPDGRPSARRARIAARNQLHTIERS
jgi:hypothetical protein